MGERKVINKYFPPDFDPAKLPKGKRTIDNLMKVRMMMGMTVQCRTCGVFIYKGTKFNMRKEDVLGEDYLGIQIYRFYFKCPRCASEITFKTDPKNGDYALEYGAHRSAEPWKLQQTELEKSKKCREEEESGDAMKALENRRLDSKREMDDLAEIEEIRIIKARHDKIGTNAVLASVYRREMLEKEKEAKEDYIELMRMRNGQMKCIHHLCEESITNHMREEKNKLPFEEFASYPAKKFTKTAITEINEEKTVLNQIANTTIDGETETRALKNGPDPYSCSNRLGLVDYDSSESMP